MISVKEENNLLLKDGTIIPKALSKNEFQKDIWQVVYKKVSEQRLIRSGEEHLILEVNHNLCSFGVID